MYTLYMCICTDRQINNRAIRLPARQAGHPLPLVRRHCWLSVPTVSHVMNNCNLYFILLVYYSLSMARFTWLGLAARGVLKVSGEGEAHVRFAAISWRFSVCVCSHTCQATLSSQSTTVYPPPCHTLPACCLVGLLNRFACFGRWTAPAPMASDCKECASVCVCVCVRRLDWLRTCLIHHFCTARQRGEEGGRGSSVDCQVQSRRNCILHNFRRGVTMCNVFGFTPATSLSLCTSISLSLLLSSYSLHRLSLRSMPQRTRRRLR